jgi:stearoyl-CoA desaturase (Delta-9 desaturase)
MSARGDCACLHVVSNREYMFRKGDSMEMISPSNDHQVNESWNTTEHTPLISNRRPLAAQLSVYLFVIIPFLSLIAAVTLTWGGSLTWLNMILSIIWYTMTMLGATVGYHRYFTHRSFKATRGVRIALAVLGSMAVQGPILHWVADHRRHHAFADRDGDPHSPWLYGTTPSAIVRGIWHAHLGWILNRDLTNQRRFAPDLLADRDIRLINRLLGQL